MQQQYKKTGMNSAHRRAIQRRQEERRFAIVGLVAGLLLLGAIVFGGEREAEKLGPEPGDTGIIDFIEQPLTDPGSGNVRLNNEHPLTRYARGVRSIEEMDRLIDSSSGD